MDNHILFFILAGLLIAILIGYSLWSARREKSRVFSNTFSTRPPSTPISHSSQTDIPASLQPQNGAFQATYPNDQAIAEQQVQQQVEQDVKNIKIRLSDVQAPVQTPFSATPEPAMHYAETAYSEPVVAEPAPNIEQPLNAEPAPAAQPIENGLITLYVVAQDGQPPFYGENIVQQLEALGFQYGQYQIFHRHLDNANSPVLFSVANMMQPGIFDLDKISQFSTVGLVFFMQLPSGSGNDLVNLRSMIRSVETFARAMNGIVLTDQHQLFDDNARQQYLLRVSQQ